MISAFTCFFVKEDSEDDISSSGSSSGYSSSDKKYIKKSDKSSYKNDKIYETKPLIDHSVTAKYGSNNKSSEKEFIIASV